MGSASDPPATVRILDSSPVYSLAAFERCVITDWRLQPTQREFARRNEALIELTDRFAGVCGYLEMIEPTSKPPPGPLRKFAMDGFRALGAKLSCVGMVVHGTELRVTFVRAVLSGMTFFVPQFQPLRVFKETDAATRWIQASLGEGANFQRRLAVAAESLRPQQHAAPAQHP
jgi:hypothetical protein